MIGRRKPTRTSWTYAEIQRVREADELISQGRGGVASALLRRHGLSMDDLEAMEARGLLDMPSGAAATVTPPQTTSPVQEGDPARHVRLPDGTDTTDPRIRAKVEAHVQAAHGPHAVVMWPRYRDIEDGIDPIIPIVNARAEAQTLALGPTVKPTDWPHAQAQAEQHGLTLVDFDPYRRQAVLASLTPETRAIRDRIAVMLKAQPHEVEVAIHKVNDGKTGRDRLDQVVVLRAPVVGIDSVKRRATWEQLVLTLPGGSQGWEVIDDPVTGTVRLRYGQPRVLPALVAMADLLPDALDTSDWHRIPVGITPEGRFATLDLTAGPHALIVGPTGSGKSVFLRQHAASALAHGHDLIIIDAIKDGIDFVSFRPWCVAFSDDGIAGARATIEAVYAEGQRRKAILKAYAAPSWADLPGDIRRNERIKPLTVIFDEFMSAVIASPVPKGLDKDDPLVEEANLLNADKATVLAIVGKIARELRFVGVFLAIAMQRADASLLTGFGEIRSNLTSALQLVKPGSLPAQETLRMVFPGEQTQAAADAIMELDDGSSKGLATIAAEGGDVAGFRVGFGKPSEIPELMTTLGVPLGTPWGVAKTAGSRAPRPQPNLVDFDLTGLVEPPAPTVQDLGEMSFSLDDLDVLDGEESQ